MLQERAVADFVERVREMACLDRFWDQRWGALKEEARALPPAGRKAALMQLLGSENDIPLLADLLIDSLESATWSADDLLALMEQLWESGVWPWEISGVWMPNGPAKGLGALWRAIEMHESGERFPDLLLRFLFCPLGRLMQPDPKSLRAALQTAMRYPAVIVGIMSSITETYLKRDPETEGRFSAALPQLLMHVHKACAGDPREVARLLAALLGAADSKPPEKWWPEWSEVTSRWGEHACRDFCEGLWGLPMEQPFIVTPLAHILIRAAIWGVVPYATSETCERLGAMAAYWMLETSSGSQSWDHGISFATAAIHALGRIGGPGLPHLQTLARKIKHKNVRKAIDEAVGQVAAGQEIDSETLLDLTAEACGLNGDGVRTWTLGDCLVTLAISDRGRPQVQYETKGRRAAAPPQAVKEEYAAVLTEIKTVTKRLQESCATQRSRLEQALIHERTWDPERWRQSFGTNPVLGNLARRMIWRATAEGEERLVRPDQTGAWLNADDAEVSLPTGCRLSLVHPVTLSRDELTAWQSHVVRHRLVQPTKQAFRETYVITPAEEQTAYYSNRFATHVVPHSLLYALIRERGWSGLGYTGAEEPARRNYPARGVRAHLCHAYDLSSDTAETMTLDHVSFVRLERHRGKLVPGAEMVLRDVPPVVFSETMRDVDLVVGVGSIGTSAFWEDWEERRQRDAALWAQQRAAYEQQMSATAERRVDLFAQVCPALGLGERVWLEGHYLLVQGRERLYRIHLGSGNIHIEPEGRYLCIVPARPRVEELYVPFEEGDLKTAEILSKVLLLADDDKITDPAIRRQLR